MTILCATIYNIKGSFSFSSEPHVFFHQVASSARDYSPTTNQTLLIGEPSSWIPQLFLGNIVREVYFRSSIFACDIDSLCKYFPIGHSHWIDAPNYQESKRSYFTMNMVVGRILIAGGRIPGGNYISGMTGWRKHSHLSTNQAINCLTSVII